MHPTELEDLWPVKLAMRANTRADCPISYTGRSRCRRQRDRYAAGVEWNPYNRIQFVLHRRWAFRASKETSADTIFMTHYWF